MLGSSVVDCMGQSTFMPDSVVLISELETVDSLLYYEGKPYTGEAFFLTNDGMDPMVMRSYVNGLREGAWKVWHANGHLHKHGETKDGLEHGRYLEYYENGIIRYEYWYDMGARTGKWRGWYETGEKYTERNFENDKLHGRLIHWNEEGEALLTERYKYGRLIETTRNKKPRAPQAGR